MNQIKYNMNINNYFIILNICHIDYAYIKTYYELCYLYYIAFYTMLYSIMRPLYSIYCTIFYLLNPHSQY